ncbi:DUF2927 domain-containing protein [Marinibaculum pumilum]|uniref:DUF2927 domain-containing protein n=1 Tax=Marinibaculum pumilum TaxID=1766165 RepID=A0ABV7L1G4_9PROT
MAPAPAIAAEQAAVDRAALLRAFSDAAFSYLPDAQEARLLKWEGEVRIAGLGTPSRTMTLTVEELSRAIKRVTGLAMGYTGQEVNFLIAFSNRPEADLTGRWADYAAPFFEDEARFRQAAASLEAADAPPCLAKLVIEERAIRAALIVVRTGDDEALANQCLAHEILGALGIIRTSRLPDDSLLRQPTAAFAAGSPASLSDSDRALLWLIYHRDMPHAVTKTDGMGIAELLLEKVPGLE